MDQREREEKVATDGLRLVIGAGGVSDAEIAGFETSLGLPAIQIGRAHV